MKKFLLFFLAFLIIVFSAGCKFGQKEIKLRMAEIHPADYPTTLADYEFARIVKQKTNGRVVIEVLHGGKLGQEKQVIEQVHGGAIDITRVSTSPLAAFDEKLNALQMPYLYRDTDHMWKVLNGEIGDSILSDLEKSDFIGIGWFDGGTRNFYTKKAVKSVNDLKGMKIRVQQSDLMMEMIKALGAKPLPISLENVYSSIQTGTIDGAENNYPSYESGKHNEVAKFYIEDEHTRIPEIIIGSKKALSTKLSKKDFEILKSAALDAQTLQIKLWNEKVSSSKEKVVSSGTTVTALNEEQKKEFENAMKPVYDKQIPEVQELIKKIKEVK